MMRKLITLCLLVLLVSAVVFAGGQKEAGKITLNFWLYGGAPRNQDANQEFVDKWNAAHPEVQVVMTKQVWDTIFEHFQTAAMSNALPDAARIHAPFINAFGAKGGYLEPLDNFADFKQAKAVYVDGFIDACSFGGHYWGIPSTPILFAMLTNKAVFDKAGMAKPSDNTWTWPQWKDTIKRLTKDLNGDGIADQYGYGIMGGELGGHAYRISPLAFLAGAVMCDDAMTKSMLNTPPWTEVVQMLVDMNLKDKSLEPGYLTDAYGEVSNKFASDRIAMSIEGPWYPDYIRGLTPGGQKEIWTLNMPKPTKITGPGVPGTLSDGSAVVIAKSSKYKQQAWEFIKFVTGPEFDKLNTDAAMGGLPVVKATYSLPEWKTFEGWEAYGALAPTSRPWPYHPSLVEITRDVIAQVTLQAIKGDISVAACMADIDKKVNEILARK
jgi:multiple sugar transport system substrate-binding protein